MLQVPFFQKIKGYPEGYHIFGCPVSASSKLKRYYARLALAPKEDIPIKASFDVMWPKEVQDKVLKNWKEYGYSE